MRFPMLRRNLDGKHSGLVEIRNRYDGSDCGAEEDLDVVADVLLGVGGMIAVLVLLIVIMVVFHILRKRGIIKRKVRKPAGRHGRDYCAFRAGEGVECRW